MTSLPVLTRQCGTCSLCCKLFQVTPLQKPAGVWCRHAKPGRAQGGCTIWDGPNKPPICNEFRCFWLDGAGTETGVDLRPTTVRAVIHAPGGDDSVEILLDPDVWRDFDLTARPALRVFADWLRDGGITVTVRKGNEGRLLRGKYAARHT